MKITELRKNETDSERNYGKKGKQKRVMLYWRKTMRRENGGWVKRENKMAETC